MKKFFVLIALSAFLTLAWLLIPLLEGRNRDAEERLLGVLDVVEQAIVANLSEAGHVDAFHLPSMRGPDASSVWTVTGVAEIQYDYGGVERESYVALVENLCPSRQKSKCWSVRKLTLGNKAIVIAEDDASVLTLPAGVLDPAANSSSPPQPLDGAPQQPLAPQPQQTETIEIKEYPPPPAIPAWSDWQELALLIQEYLKDLGYDPGPEDGMIGPRTVTAIEQFQRNQGLEVDGEASEELLRRLVETLHVQQSEN